MENLSRYRVLEIFVRSIAELDAPDADPAVLIAKLKRQAKKALNHKAPPRNEKLGEARAKARDTTIRKAKEFRAQMLPLIKQARQAGAASTRQIADWLNAAGHQTPRGFKWSSASVHRIIKGDE